MSFRAWSWLSIVALILPAASLSGCAGAAPKSQLYDKVEGGNLTLGALRIRVRDLARRIPAALEDAANELAEGSTNAEQRQRLTEFKSNGVPMLQSVLLQRDPAAAILDGWTLLYQLRDVLQKNATAVDPALLNRIVSTVEGQAEELARLWAELTGRADVGASRRVQQWAREHPLKGSLLARESTAPLLASLVDRSQLPALSAAGSALEDLQDLITRIDLYALNLPRQARWQAEAALGDLALSPEMERATRSLQHAVDLIEPLSELASNTSGIVRRERTAVLAQLDQERRAFQTFFRDERVAVLAQLGSERDATIRQVDEMTERVVNRAFDRLERILLLAGLGTLALLVVAVALGWLLFTHGRPRGQPRPAPIDRRTHDVLIEREA